MRITVMAVGSQGDVQPCVALAAGLMRAGHHVRVVTFENFRRMIERAGLEFHAIKGDVSMILNTEAGVSLSESGDNPFAFMKRAREAFAQVAELYVEAFSSPELRDSEAVINQLPVSAMGWDIAQKLNVPHLIAAVIPLTKTGAFPLPLVTQASFGAWFNRLTYSFSERMAWMLYRDPVNRVRANLGMPPAPLFGRFRKMRGGKPTPILYGLSEHVIPRPRDWGAHVHMTGYWILEEPEWQPPRYLLDFLQEGEPPIFFGFGSMPMRDPVGFTRTITEALKQAGLRGLLSSGWGGMATGDLSQHTLRIGYTPYAWLFPRTAGVVHHGGSGTTGLGLRGGVPSLIVPFLSDQYYWGGRVAALGAGPQMIPREKLTVDTLAAALHQMATDAAMKAKAAALGEKLRAEDGISTAVKLIEGYLGVSR